MRFLMMRPLTYGEEEKGGRVWLAWRLCKWLARTPALFSLSVSYLLVDLHAQRALGHVPHDAGAAVVEFVRHALGRRGRKRIGRRGESRNLLPTTSLPPPLTLWTAELTLMST